MESSKWHLQSADYLDALMGQNPWHTLGRVPEVFSFPTCRALADVLWQTVVDRPWRYQVVLGPRRVGKTVSMYQTVQKLIDHGISPQRLWFMRMDHPLFQNYPLGGWVKSLLQKEKPTHKEPLYLFLDEVNYSKQWDLWLKTFYDEKWPIQVVATSSSAAALKDRHVESGVGRWSEQYLMPYNFGEYCQLAGKGESELNQIDGDTFFDDLVQACSCTEDTSYLQQERKMFTLIGGFPELLTQGFDLNDVASSILRSQQVLRSEAIQRVAGMDLPQAFHVRQPLVLERLLYLLAGQMCGMVSVRKLGGSLEVNHQTISQYIAYLEKAYLIFTLPAYSSSEETVQRRGRKVYFVDGAIRNAALQRGVAPFGDSDEAGPLVENLVGSHLFAICLQNDVRLFHWRERKQEVDFVYDDPQGPIAIEVTTSANHHLKGLKALSEKYPEFQGRCFLVSMKSSACHPPKDDAQGIGRIPLETFLLAASSRAKRAMKFRLENA